MEERGGIREVISKPGKIDKMNNKQLILEHD